MNSEHNPEWQHIQALQVYDKKLRALLKEGCELVEGKTLVDIAKAVETLHNEIEYRIAIANDQKRETLSVPVSLSPQEKIALMNITPFSAANKPNSL